MRFVQFLDFCLVAEDKEATSEAVSVASYAVLDTKEIKVPVVLPLLFALI
jgi:hypothetical protein